MEFHDTIMVDRSIFSGKRIDINQSTLKNKEDNFYNKHFNAILNAQFFYVIDLILTI